jgi:hypothetical protein
MYEAWLLYQHRAMVTKKGDERKGHGGGEGQRGSMRREEE